MCLSQYWTNISSVFKNLSLRKKCQYSELFWSAFFPDFLTFGLNTEDTVHLSVFSPNVGKCGQNSDRNKSEHGIFSGSVYNWVWLYYHNICWSKWWTARNRRQSLIWHCLLINRNDTLFYRKLSRDINFCHLQEIYPKKYFQKSSP